MHVPDPPTFTTHSGDFAAKALIGDHSSYDVNPGVADWDEADNHVLGLWIKNAAGTPLALTVLVEAGAWDPSQIDLITDSGTDNHAGTCYTDYLGTGLNDGEWHYLELDLGEVVDALAAGHAIQRVNGLVVRGRDVYVDDIVLSKGRLGTSWAAVPGAAIGGVLGAQTGADGANGVSAWDQYYYHYNDLGTVLATTDLDGDLLGVYEPDHFGNYRFVYGTKPDSMGLTGKFFDTSAGLYYFNARWLDPERGRWMSKDPSGYYDGILLYGFTHNSPVNNYDPTGLFVPWPIVPMNPHSHPKSYSECGAAPPKSTASGICDIYKPCDSFMGYDAKCVCEGAGESAWDQKVRGCLACFKNKHQNVSHDVAHNYCYGVANKQESVLEGVIQMFDIGLNLTWSCLFGVQDSSTDPFNVGPRSYPGNSGPGTWTYYPERDIGDN